MTIQKRSRASKNQMNLSEEGVSAVKTVSSGSWISRAKRAFHNALTIVVTGAFLLMNTFAGGLIAQTAQAAAGGGGGGGGGAPTYSIEITSTSGTTLTLSIAGNASSTNPPGLLSQYHVVVDWGDATSSEALTNFSFDGNGDLSGTWSADHTYATSGTYTVTAQLYHGTQAGAEASDAIDVAVVVIPVTPTDPKLTVTKVVSGGTAVVGDFPLFVSSTPVTSGVENTFAAGTYVVTETNLAGYTGVFSGDCDASGTIALASGDVKSCTLTNTFTPAATTSTLVVVKQVINNDAGTSTASDFTLNVTGTNVSQASFPGNASGTTITLDAGSYSVSESTSTGYAATFSTDCSGTLAVGETKTCTVTNNDNAVPPPPGSHALTVLTNGGVGSGSVSSTPSGIDCGVDCNENYVENTSVSLTATPDTNSYFESWTGCDTVSGTVCTVDMASDENVTASFGKLVITSEALSGVASTSVTVTWTTNHPATSRVIWGTAPVEGTIDGSSSTEITSDKFGYASSNEEDSTLVTSHSMTVTGLTASTQYYFRAVSHGSPAAVSSQLTVTTLAAAPVVNPPIVSVGGSIAPPGASVGGGGFGTVLGVSTTTAPQGQVLGVSTTTCDELLTSYIKMGKQNDVQDVMDLQQFLNDHLSAGLPVSGFYGNMTRSWVNKFQMQYASEVLRPWVPYGLRNESTATGYVYKTTRRQINNLYCSTLNLPMPQLP